MDKFYDIFSAPNFADFMIERNQNRTPPLGSVLFPARKQLGLDLSFIKGKNGAPRVLKASAFYANAPLRDRLGTDVMQMELPFFREKYIIKEKDRQEMLRLLSGNQTNYAQQVASYVFDDAMDLELGAQAALERMRHQLLYSGKITFVDSEGASHVFDYGLDEAKQKVELTLQDMWSDPSSTPVTDIIKWRTQVRKNTGVAPTRGIMNSDTFALIANNITIRKDINPLGAENIILTDDDVLTYLTRKTGITFAIYDDVFTAEDGTVNTYYPTGYVTLLPPGNLGYTVFGTTPEEADLMSGAPHANVSIINTGMALATYKNVHTVTVNTQLSMVSLPSFEQADKIFIAKVSA